MKSFAIMSERPTYQPSPIEILFPQGLTLLAPKVISRLPDNVERWINKFIIEPKLNGIRACVEIAENGRVRILTRERNEVTGFPRLRERLSTIGKTSLVLDGEIIAGEGKTDKERQTVSAQAFSRQPYEVGNIRFAVFDALMLDGAPLLDFPIEGRKRALARLITDDVQEELNIVRTEFALDDHLAFMDATKGEKFEGIVLKRKGSKYKEPHPMSRQPHPWVKYKFR